MRVLTLGHGTLDPQQFTALTTSGGIERIVDIRRYPGSRAFPHFGREEMESWVPAGGVGYVWMPSLGGRRRPAEGSPNQALRNAQFRAYADHMASEEFAEGVSELLELADDALTGVLCSESVWWRCHRRLLADHLVLLRGVGVEHVFHDGRRQEHPPLPDARAHDGRLVYSSEERPPPK